jgi:hypothetical protein
MPPPRETFLCLSALGKTPGIFPKKPDLRLDFKKIAFIFASPLKKGTLKGSFNSKLKTQNSKLKTSKPQQLYKSP